MSDLLIRISKEGEAIDASVSIDPSYECPTGELSRALGILECLSLKDVEWFLTNKDIHVRVQVME